MRSNLFSVRQFKCCSPFVPFCFDQSTVGFQRWSTYEVGVFGGPLSSPGLLSEWIALPGAWALLQSFGGLAVSPHSHHQSNEWYHDHHLEPPFKKTFYSILYIICIKAICNLRKFWLYNTIQYNTIPVMHVFRSLSLIPRFCQPGLWKL